jgi:hypothetical protein
MYLLTPESDHHGFTNALCALYELLYLQTPESDHHGFTNAPGVHKVHSER